MPLIKKPEDDETIAVTFRIKKSLHNEIKSYCKWSGIKIGYFLSEGMQNHVLGKDREWKKFKKEHGLKF